MQRRSAELRFDDHIVNDISVLRESCFDARLNTGRLSCCNCPIVNRRGQGRVEGQLPEKLCGRPLSIADIAVIREQIRLARPANRPEIARRVCRALDWTNALGEPKLMSARVGLLRRLRSQKPQKRLSSRRVATTDARRPATGTRVVHDHRMAGTHDHHARAGVCPEMPCDVVFETAEWQAVYLVTQRKTPPSLDQMVRIVAGLGGISELR